MKHLFVALNRRKEGKIWLFLTLLCNEEFILIVLLDEWDCFPKNLNCWQKKQLTTKLSIIECISEYLYICVCESICEFFKKNSLCVTWCHQKCKGVRAVIGFMDESVHISVFECLCVHACVYLCVRACLRGPVLSSDSQLYPSMEGVFRYVSKYGWKSYQKWLLLLLFITPQFISCISPCLYTIYKLAKIHVLL